MKNKMKAVSKLIAVILGNTAAIGLGIGLYENRAAYFAMALLIALTACLIEWESEK